MKKGILLTFAFILSVSVSGCETAAGIQQDFKDFNASLNAKTKELTAPKAEVVTSDTEARALDVPICPPIIVDPQLKSLTEFYDEKNPSSNTIVSSVHLARASSSCEQGPEYITLTIELAFDGKLGPKARRKKSDQTFFAYPYFVSVRDNDGNEVVKEMFAASMTYSSNQNKQSLVETIRQKLPRNNKGNLPSYQVHVGFQLTENQLFYNASL